MLVATAYMEEAERFDWLVAMNAGEVLATGSAKAAAANAKRHAGRSIYKSVTASTTPHQAVVIPPYQPENAEIAIEARDLTMRLVPSAAVDHAQFPHSTRGDFWFPRFERLR